MGLSPAITRDNVCKLFEMLIRPDEGQFNQALRGEESSLIQGFL